MDILSNTGVPIKKSGDGLSHQDINSINSTANDSVEAVNYLLHSFCNINAERENFEEHYTLGEAVNFVPMNRRKQGMKIRFLSSHTGKFEEYIYEGDELIDSNWENIENWNNTINFIDGGEW